MSEIFTAAFWAEYGGILAEGLLDTLVMVVLSTLFAYLIGLPMGVASVLSQPHGIRPHKAVNSVLGWVINIGRSFPFAILMVALFPFTKLVMGTRLGLRGAILPLVVASAPFVARMVETSLSEVDAGVIEAAKSMGASTWQIIYKVLLPESKPSLLVGAAISVTTILGYTAMGGFVGAGGLGAIAINYGYYRYQTDIMLITVAIMVIIVQIIQESFMKLSKVNDKRIR